MEARRDQLVGKAKEFQGKATEDTDKEVEGKVQHAQGDVEKAVDDGVDGIRGASKSVGDKLSGH